MLRLPAVMLNSSPPASLPGVSLTNGPIVRATSRCPLVSTRITVAPKSAMTRVVAGPAIAHVRSSTLRPVEGVASGAAVGCGNVGSPRARLAADLVGVLAEPRRPTEVDLRHGAGAPPRARGVDRDLGERLVLHVVEVVAGRELRAGVDVVGRGHRGDQQDLVARRLEQLGLRPRRAELADDVLQALVLLDRLATVVEHVGVVEPVLVPRRLVAAALLVDPGHQPLRERTDRRAEQEGHRHEAVLARPQQLDVETTGLDAAAGPLSRRPAERHGQRVALRRLHHRALGRDLDVLAASARRPLGQGNRGADGGVSAGVEERLGDGRAHWRPVVVAGHRQLAPGRLHGEIGGRPCGLRAGRAERRDRHRDERRVGGPQGGQVDRDGPALEHDVGACTQLGEHGLALGRLEIGDDAALGAIPSPERERALGIDDVSRVRPAAATRAAARRLDEDDVGPEAGEDVGGQVAPVIGQVDDPVGLEHRCVPPKDVQRALRSRL